MHNSMNNISNKCTTGCAIYLKIAHSVVQYASFSLFNWTLMGINEASLYLKFHPQRIPHLIHHSYTMLTLAGWKLHLMYIGSFAQIVVIQMPINNSWWILMRQFKNGFSLRTIQLFGEFDSCIEIRINKLHGFDPPDTDSGEKIGSDLRLFVINKLILIIDFLNQNMH